MNFLIFDQMENPVSPEKEKKERIRSMFDSIAWRYDFLNHFLSLNADKVWREKAIREVSMLTGNSTILDVATGTGDLAIAAMKLDPQKITGIDISEKMLELAREKIRKKGLEGRIEVMTGESENIPFPEGSFDLAMVAFGVRNFADPLKGLSEMHRVLRHDGMIMVLEFSRPSGFPFRNLYNMYFKNILPSVGRMFSKDRIAYDYLPRSVMQFPDNEAFLKLLGQAGFRETKQKRLTGGIASIYTGKK